jgi:hypothetical protein
MSWDREYDEEKGATYSQSSETSFGQGYSLEISGSFEGKQENPLTFRVQIGRKTAR